MYRLYPYSGEDSSGLALCQINANEVDTSDFDETQNIVWVDGENKPHQILMSLSYGFWVITTPILWVFVDMGLLTTISQILKGFRICQWYHFKSQLMLSRLINLEVKGHQHQLLTSDYTQFFSVDYSDPSPFVSQFWSWDNGGFVRYESLPGWKHIQNHKIMLFSWYSLICNTGIGHAIGDLGEKILAKTILIIPEFHSLCILICWSLYLQ